MYRVATIAVLSLGICTGALITRSETWCSYEGQEERSFTGAVTCGGMVATAADSLAGFTLEPDGTIGVIVQSNARAQTLSPDAWASAWTESTGTMTLVATSDELADGTDLYLFGEFLITPNPEMGSGGQTASLNNVWIAPTFDFLRVYIPITLGIPFELTVFTHASTYASGGDTGWRGLNAGRSLYPTLATQFEAVSAEYPNRLAGVTFTASDALNPVRPQATNRHPGYVPPPPPPPPPPPEPEPVPEPSSVLLGAVGLAALETFRRLRN